MSEKARFVGINHVALEVGDVDQALQYDEIQFTKTAALRVLGVEGLGKTAKAEAEMREKGLL